MSNAVSSAPKEFSQQPFAAGMHSPVGAQREDRLALYCVAMLFGSYLFPAEAAVRIGTVFTMRRVMIIACLIPLALALTRKFRSQRFVPVASDFFVLGLAIWTPLAAYISGGIGATVSNLGVLGFELLVPYFIARLMLGDVATFKRSCNIIFIVTILMLLLGFLDTLSGENLLGRVSTEIFGNFRTVKFYGDVEVLAGSAAQYRFGFARARGPIEHSILFGMFFVVMAPILYYNLQGSFKRLSVLAVCSAGVAIALSSAPILIFAVFLVALAYDELFSRVPWRWSFFVMMLLIVMVSVFSIVDDPVVAFIRGFTLDPQTGLTRLEIWHWVGQNLVISPIFGVGTRDWFRPWDLLSSIDALWLVIALQYGYVGLALLIGAVVGSFFVITPRPIRNRQNGPHAIPRFAVTASLLLFLLASFTVHVWGASWGLLGIILGLRAAYSEAGYLPLT